MPVATASKLHASRIDLSEATRESVIQVLQPLLGSSIDLKTQIKQAHWNVKGREFIALHELFDMLAKEVESNNDDIAERITALGGIAQGSSRLSARNSILNETPLETIAGSKLVEEIASRYAELVKAVREGIEKVEEAGDAVTADLLTGYAGLLDQRLWFLEAHLQGPEGFDKPQRAF